MSTTRSSNVRQRLKGRFGRSTISVNVTVDTANMAHVEWQEVPRAISYSVQLDRRTSGDYGSVYRTAVSHCRMTCNNVKFSLEAGGAYRVTVKALLQRSFCCCWTYTASNSVTCEAGAPVAPTIKANSVDKVTAKSTSVSPRPAPVAQTSTADSVDKVTAKSTSVSRRPAPVAKATTADSVDKVTAKSTRPSRRPAPVAKTTTANSVGKVTGKSTRSSRRPAPVFSNIAADNVDKVTAKSTRPSRRPAPAVTTLTLHVNRKYTTEAEVTWLADSRTELYNVQLTERTGQAWAQTTKYNGDLTDTVVRFNLTAGKFYKVTVKGKQQTPNGNLVIVAEGSANFRAELTIGELKELHRRAMRLVSSCSMRRLRWFYRTKMPNYFNDIASCHGNIMIGRTKDNNGDQGSPINGVIKGVFFSVNVERDGKPRTPSPFGSKQLFIPAECMFQKLRNLYFTDFYCNFKQHYVTLVMTKDGSEADQFCREKLLSVDVAPNPFV